jgi:hypothetical protein
MTHLRLGSPLVLFGLLTAGGCGGDDDIDCSFEACGGDPVGEWRLGRSCGEATVQGCPDAVVDDSDVDQTADLSVVDDMTYSAHVVTEGTVHASIPLSCLDGGTCADLAAVLSAPCTTDGDDCACDIDAASDVSESGGWATTGNTITFTPDAGDPYEADYCADGGSLKFQFDPTEPDQIVVFVK